jgi:hypothetical protein
MNQMLLPASVLTLLACGGANVDPNAPLRSAPLTATSSQSAAVSLATATPSIDAPAADAGPPQPARFKTTFKYEARFGDGVRTYNENADQMVPVWLPADLRWQCNRNTPILIDERTRSGFLCSNDGWKTDVLIIVGCKTSGADPTHAAGLRIYGPRPDGRPQGEPVDGGAPSASFGHWVDLAVSCETVAEP